MSITDTVQREVVQAMKAGDKQRLSALRMILSQLQLGRKEAGGEFAEQQEIAVLMTEKKKRLQSAEAFRSAGRIERAEQEDAEAGLIDTYLPRALSPEELEAIVSESVAVSGASGPADMGKVMSVLMPRIAGRADGKAVSELVRRHLST